MSKSAEELIKFTCPRCGKMWYEDPADLPRDEVVYQDTSPLARTIEYQSNCPRCGTRSIATASTPSGS